MSRYKTLSTKNDYYLPEHEYLTAVHYALQYPQWCKELRRAPDSSKAITYDKIRVQSSNEYDANAELAMRRYEIARKKEMVERTAKEAGPEIYKWLLWGVTKGLTYWQLRQRGIPCGKNMYYTCRQRFYFELSKKI